MKIRRMLGATAALAAASAALATPASAATTSTAGTSADAKKTFARLVGPVVADPKNPEIGYVTAVYRCFGEGALWVSVKQTEDRSRDQRLTEEGSSRISAAWSDSHRNPVTCDGRTRLQVFTVDQEEPAYPSETPKSGTYGPLKRGWGWVQFCLFDANNAEAPYTENAFRRVLAKR
jgi:hypothetical protein